MARFSRTKSAPPAPAAKAGARSAGKGSGKGAGKGKDVEPADTPGRVEQVKAVWTLTRENDPKILLLVLGPALAVLVVLVLVGILIGHVILFSVLAVFLAVFTGVTIFGRRATSTMYSQVEGRPGAGVAVLQGMRGDWRVTPAVGFTRNQDLVHRVVGRPGVVIVGEGSSVSAVRQLVVDQKRRVGRVAPDTPLYDVIVGDGDGQVPVRKLQQHLTRLPRNLKQKDINAVEARLKALGGTSAPLPKGPMPQRMPRGKTR